jgi:prepilin-type N-terminal cleavage/methylation domain-containing protein
MASSTKKSQTGFSMVEVLVSLFVVSILTSVISSVVVGAASLNARTTLRAEAGSLAFKKVQDYMNQSFDNIPLGLVATSYEVEDFAAEAEALNLKNVNAKVYVEPESVLQPPTTTTRDYNQTIAADSAFVGGSEINTVNTKVHDATGYWYAISRMSDDSYTNYTYSGYTSNPDNLAGPSINLGSAQIVESIRVNWYACRYGASNFRVEAKNSSPTTNSGWTTIVSGLSDNMAFSCSAGDLPQDINVSASTTPYQYWRLYFVDADDSDFAVISELEAYSVGSPGDIVEQQGADATASPGALFFSDSALEMSENSSFGHQSVGIIFDGIDTAQGATINDAYIEFTADQSNAGAVELLVSGVDVDTTTPWSGSYAVDRAVDNDSSDGKTGTAAKITWVPAVWVAGDAGANTRVDVTPIVKELVDRLGWTVDNSMAFAFQYLSGSDRRVAQRSPSARLVVNWSETTTSISNYEDADGDGDVDNPTLVRVTAIVEYDAFGRRHSVMHEAYVRRFGVTD